jgi:tetratricopeptide (TPR) repeat protein
MRVIFTVFILVCAVAASAQSLNQKRKQAEPQTQTQTQPQTQTQSQPQGAAPAQKPVLSPSSQRHLLKYATANRWNDAVVARNALYDLIIENPTNDSLIFTLGYLYYESQQYASSLLVAQDLVARNPKSEAFLELAAVSAQELGVGDRALQHFESLYLINNNITTLYQIAFLQYNLKKYNESRASADIILAKPEATTSKVVFNDPQGQPKEYPMKVAVLNLKGLVALDSGDKAAAKKSFSDAMAVAPDFVPAKENLEKTK